MLLAARAGLWELLPEGCLLDTRGDETACCWLAVRGGDRKAEPEGPHSGTEAPRQDLCSPLAAVELRAIEHVRIASYVVHIYQSRW